MTRDWAESPGSGKRLSFRGGWHRSTRWQDHARSGCGLLVLAATTSAASCNGLFITRDSRQQALDELKRLEAQARSGRMVSHYGLAVIHAALGSTDRALAELETAFNDREWAMFLLKWDPAFDKMRSDPRFVRIVERVGLSP